MNFNIRRQFENSSFRIGFDLFEKQIYLNLNILYSFYNYKICLLKVNKFSNYLNRDFSTIFLNNNNQQVESLILKYNKNNFISNIKKCHQ